MKNAYACVVYKDNQGVTECLYVDESGIPWFPITYTGESKEMFVYHPLRGYIDITPPQWNLQRGEEVRLTQFRTGR